MMVGVISGAWFWFLIGNLLSDAGIAVFALFVYKANEATSEFSNKLIEEAGGAAADAATQASIPPEPMPESEPPSDFPSSGAPNVPPEGPPVYPFRVPPRDEIVKWRGRQKYPLIFFGVGLAIQIFTLFVYPSL